MLAATQFVQMCPGPAPAPLHMPNSFCVHAGALAPGTTANPILAAGAAGAAGGAVAGHRLHMAGSDLGSGEGSVQGHPLAASDMGSNMGSRPASLDFQRRPGSVAGHALGSDVGADSRPASLDYQRSPAQLAAPSVAGHALGSDVGADSRPASLDYQRSPAQPAAPSVVGHALGSDMGSSSRPASLDYQRMGAPSVAGHAIPESVAGSDLGSRPGSLVGHPVAPGSELGSDVGSQPASCGYQPPQRPASLVQSTDLQYQMEHVFPHGSMCKLPGALAVTPVLVRQGHITHWTDANRC